MYKLFICTKIMNPVDQKDQCKPRAMTPFRKLLLDRMWQDKIAGKAAFAVCCTQCGGGTAAFCACAKERFIKTVTDEQIDLYRDTMDNNELIRQCQQRIQSLKAQLEQAETDLQTYLSVKQDLESVFF